MARRGVRRRGTVDDLLLDVGDESWLATTALADLDTDGVLETNSDELIGLAELPSSGDAGRGEVEEGTQPAVVHTVNELSYRPTE